MATTKDVPVIQTYEDVEQAMKSFVEEVFYQSPFFVWLLEGRYSSSQIRHFAVQYSYYSRHFPRVLGAAISAMAPMGSWWIPLADNLWDEAGRGKPGMSHEALYRTFLLSVDPEIELDPHGFPPDPMSPAVDEAVRTFIEFFRHATPLEAMAAVGFGSEFFAGDVMGTIARGLRHPHYNRERTLNLLFWDVHAGEHEPHHYQLCKDVLIRYTRPEELRTMYEVGTAIARSEARMYQALHEEMMAR
ncbi:hypothetical protein GCM10010885_22840 [Alicyclobacillus cellulosilyticus]|uniref:Pyrroloquinoline quinone (PQQ) biosynthesis protein C n=1 Tax=Alicyclobacillus cellulosilyticus TaxID=1003997 RepID=A0A917KHS4_9BACL|nr:iron-containing redox enzyme family protein [Alicyclobacillus cellulosilyticus]GGJ12965.1 hypothetical protein GCM10010885_22840 [Alicyclobacillus cellulosilyticus]